MSRKNEIAKSQFVEVKQLNTSNDITTYETVNQKRFTVFSLSNNLITTKTGTVNQKKGLLFFLCLKAERRTYGRRKKRDKRTTT